MRGEIVKYRRNQKCQLSKGKKKGKGEKRPHKARRKPIAMAGIELRIG